MNEISIFNKGSMEHKALEKAAEMLTDRSPNGWKYYVGETYFDYGQDWKWTTILCRGGITGCYQAISPLEQLMILQGDLDEAIDHVFSSKYCPDRKEA